MNRDRYPFFQKRTPITEGFLISVEEYDNFLKSPQLPRLYSEYSSILCVYAIYPKLSRITCYPGNFFTVVKIYFKFTNEGMKEYKKHSQLLNSYSVIHTTGLSRSNSSYIVEYYIGVSDEHSQWIKFKELIDQFRSSSNIQRCEGELIHFQDHFENG
ncbi:MAG: hypothetical protein DRO88_06695 [Promethearchaeia archaeon]|nr:MAG: hypothetical protein DRO88_06695 [Candidatus Lokiarchaeia archaeon]